VVAIGSRWRKFRLHLTLLVLLPTFIVLANWQLHRALGGNGLSWAYTIEWPLFAIYAIVIWWRLLHEEKGILPRVPKWRSRHSGRDRARAENEDRERAEYNAYLEALRVEDEARQRRSG
jgi:hypothetical protein